MKSVQAIVSWAQSLGVGGAFFIITLAAFALCMAPWVVLTVVQRSKP